MELSMRPNSKLTTREMNTFDWMQKKKKLGEIAGHSEGWTKQEL
jgi:hypothetical protein